MSHDREAKSGAAGVTRPRRVDAVEALEDAAEVLKGNPGTRVADADRLFHRWLVLPLER